ncbi:MAG: Bax inhibitor-1/YccA family protein [Methylococcus sp.]|jgi:modulator of FtsH protease|nr:MAG: Bax inhibitor-1/YccA family protein [Methylococcus sp.]
MNTSQTISQRRPAQGLLATHKVLRNTYALLSMTLMFSAACAYASMLLELPHPGLLITLGGYFGLFFLVNRFRNSAWGLVCLFALTGFMGMTLGPILNAYIGHYANGAQLVLMSLGGTGITFVGLSAYALISRKDFGFMGGMLSAGILVAFIASLAVAFIPGLEGGSVAIAALFVLLMAGLILFETSQIIHGGETNYILATLGLYVTIYNLFTSLLQIFGVLERDD